MSYTWVQISANRGSDSRFELESNLKTLSPRSSRSSIMNVMNRDQSKHEFKHGSKTIDYFGSYTNIDSHKDHFTPLYEFIHECIKKYPIYD